MGLGWGVDVGDPVGVGVPVEMGRGVAVAVGLGAGVELGGAVGVDGAAASLTRGSLSEAASWADVAVAEVRAETVDSAGNGVVASCRPQAAMEKRRKIRMAGKRRAVELIGSEG